MIRVGVNGYHTIGSRVADAIRKQSDMQLVGVSKVKPDYRAGIAHDKGIEIYAANKKSLESFRNSGMNAVGTLDELLKKVDVIVDATPDEVGASNMPDYEKAGVKGIFQGGEEHSLTNFSFVAQCHWWITRSIARTFSRSIRAASQLRTYSSKMSVAPTPEMPSFAKSPSGLPA